MKIRLLKKLRKKFLRHYLVQKRIRGHSMRYSLYKNIDGQWVLLDAYSKPTDIEDAIRRKVNEDIMNYTCKKYYFRIIRIKYLW